MRIKAIWLSWFRGAADPVALEPDCKSMLIYGANGSGKSSFVDAVEFVIKDGKIGHLAHEYSGKRQEKAIPNTHKPQGEKTIFSIKFKDALEIKTEFQLDGSWMISGEEAVDMGSWDYRRTVLRQDEVASFIHDTKGGKYSALLSLLGLHHLEMAAENLRQLEKAVDEISKLREVKSNLRELQTRRLGTFGTDSDSQVIAKIEDLHLKYCATNAAATMDVLTRCDELTLALGKRIAESSAAERRHVALQDTAALDLEGDIGKVLTASVKLADDIEPLISEKLELLQSASDFVDKLGDEKEVICPACGRPFSVDAFQAHVKSERVRLGDIIDTYNTRKLAIENLCNTVRSLKSNLSKADVKQWRDELASGPLGASFMYLETISIEALRTSCGEKDLKALEGALLPLINAAMADSRDAPPSALQLSTDKHTIQTGRAIFAAKEQAAAVERAETLISFINSLEQGIREEIRLRSQTVISEITADIQNMWAILHPGEAIDEVRLYLPKDTDKAIDIGLKFHGVKQNSPRLTLSEGHRNSLGLCIFLAMAKREADKDRPIFLDDVVISMDRNHRGMIIELLQKEFSKRQLIILTHDRDWFTELRQQLDDKNWISKALIPYETPKIGIRWSHKTTTFDDARAQLQVRPDSAGNDARKIMDVELALFAERLQMKLPFLRGDKNDKRMTHEFLVGFVADGKKCFQKKSGEEYKPYTDAIIIFEEADRLLTSWANRASHTFDLVRPEAIKLIDSCEKALGCFKCLSCGKGVWLAKAEGSEWVQCQCGQIRWRYGNA